MLALQAWDPYWAPWETGHCHLTRKQRSRQVREMADSQLSSGQPMWSHFTIQHSRWRRMKLLLKEQIWIVLIQMLLSTRTEIHLDITMQKGFVVWELLAYFNNYFKHFWNTADSEVEHGSFFNKMQQHYVSSAQEMKKCITSMYKYLKNFTWTSCNCFNREIELTA